MKILKNVQYYVLFAIIGALGLSSCQKEDIGLEELKKEDFEEQANTRFLKGTMQDQDGNTYSTVQIGSQVWMAQNLKVTTYKNGVPINNITSNTEWRQTTSGAYCWWQNDINNKNSRGAYYNWYAVSNPNSIAPNGWRVPTQEDFEILRNYLGGSNVAGGKLKQSRYSTWNAPNPTSSNTGFNALGIGVRGPYGFFDSDRNFTSFWASDLQQEGHAISMALGFDHEYQQVCTNYEYVHGYSIRLIRNELATIGTFIIDLNSTSAILTANITNDNGCPVTERGFCYSKTNTTPNVNNSKIVCGSGIGSFNGTITPTLGVTYYVRAYAKNDGGIRYSEVKSFTIEEEVDFNMSQPIGSGNTIKMTSTYTSNTDVIEVGYCWSEDTSVLPTIENNNVITCTLNQTFQGQFTINPNIPKAYIMRAYAKTNSDTFYSAAHVVVKTPGGFFYPPVSI